MLHKLFACAVVPMLHVVVSGLITNIGIYMYAPIIIYTDLSIFLPTPCIGGLNSCVIDSFSYMKRNNNFPHTDRSRNFRS